jgi:hypothetical protein
MQARQQQTSLANIMQQRATGGAPTIAQMQADRQMQQAQAMQQQAQQTMIDAAGKRYAGA